MTYKYSILQNKKTKQVIPILFSQDRMIDDYLNNILTEEKDDYEKISLMLFESFLALHAVRDKLNDNLSLNDIDKVATLIANLSTKYYNTDN